MYTEDLLCYLDAWLRARAAVHRCTGDDGWCPSAVEKAEVMARQALAGVLEQYLDRLVARIRAQTASAPTG